MAKIAVTGGNGFIGKAVVKRLQQEGHQALVLDLPRCDIRSSLLDQEPEIGSCDGMIHLAGVLGTHELFDDAQNAIDTNVTGTLNVLKACVECKLKYVGITMPDVFPSIYTATKLCATRLATAFHHAYALPVCHVRAFNVFGPGQAYGPGKPQKIIPTFATLAWRGEDIPIWGDGEQTVDLIYVDTLARILVAALQFGDDGVIDGGSGIAMKVNMVAGLVRERTGTRSALRYFPMRKGEIPTKIHAYGEGWERVPMHPSVNLMENLIKTIDSYK